MRPDTHSPFSVLDFFSSFCFLLSFCASGLVSRDRCLRGLSESLNVFCSGRRGNRTRVSFSAPHMCGCLVLFITEQSRGWADCVVSGGGGSAGQLISSHDP